MRSYRMPPSWTDAGARWGNDGLLYLGEWRRGFPHPELRALFFDCQQLQTLRRERDSALAASEQASAKIEQLEKSIYWYRRQLVAESRLGPMLARLAHRPGDAPPGCFSDT